MATAKELTVEVSAKLTVSDETAERCMRLLEMWMDDNPDRMIICDNINNRHTLRIASPGMDSRNEP